MHRIKWKLLVVCFAVTSLLLVSACVAPVAPSTGTDTQGSAEAATEAGSEAAAAPGEPRRGGVLTVARSADANLWDPKFTNDNYSLWAQGQVFATLLQNSPDGTEILPYLAESYEMNDDASEYTFTLRDAAFCDGSPITAEDVKWSFDRAMEEDSAVSWQFPSSPQVEAVDEKTVRITLSGPNVAFPSYLTLWGMHILSKAYGESVGDEVLANEPLGSGAFCLESWTKGEEIVLTPNPGYWEENRPYVDEVRLKVVADDNARVLQIQTGEVDIALDIPYPQMQVVSQMPDLVLGTNTLYGTGTIALNQRTVPAFADKNVRLAMAHAIDRQAIVDAVLFGQGVVAKSPFYGPDILYWTGDFEIPYDLDRAKQLMAESDFPDGFDATLTLQAGDSLGQQTAVILADQLAELGINLTINPVESGAWWEQWSGGEYEALYKLGTNDVIDPAENIPFDFWPNDLGGTADAAFTGYRNEELVEMSKQAEAELDPEARRQLYYDVQRIAMEDSPQLWIFHPSNRWATRTNVQDFSLFNTGLHRFWEVWKTAE